MDAKLRVNNNTLRNKEEAFFQIIQENSPNWDYKRSKE